MAPAAAAPPACHHDDHDVSVAVSFETSGCSVRRSLFYFLFLFSHSCLVLRWLRCEKLKRLCVVCSSSRRRKRTRTRGSRACTVGTSAPASVSTAGGRSLAVATSAGSVCLSFPVYLRKSRAFSHGLLDRPGLPFHVGYSPEIFCNNWQLVLFYYSALQVVWAVWCFALKRRFC